MSDDVSRCERCGTPSDFAIAVLKVDGVLEDVCEDCFDKEVAKKKGANSAPTIPPWMASRMARPVA